MAEYQKGIKSWAEEDRPREKLLAKGKLALSDAELIAILIGSGTREESAVEVSRKLLFKFKNNLNQLGKCTVEDLTTVKGIGEAKAITIVAAMELARRRKETDLDQKIKVTSSRNVYEYMKDVMSDLPHEEFWIVLLNRSNTIIERHQMFKGGVSATVADVKMICKLAIDKLASGIILCHNHPSGNMQPSKEDIRLTEKVNGATELLDINLLDHLIFGDEKYISFKDEGLI